jgi:LmbE family N-acetylglucosaminyl deacetylase
MMSLGGRSLMAIFAHPDDESLACGGLLALCASLGMDLSLVCATRGEGGSVGARAISPDELADQRVAELGHAADELGVSKVIVLDFEDGMLPWVDGDDLRDAVTGLLVDRAPDVVVTFDEDGLYWHPDHLAVHQATTEAVAALEGTAPALYYASLPPGQMRALVEVAATRLGPGANLDLLGVSDPDAFGTMAPPPTIILDVTAVAGRKLAALRCHASQTRGGPFTAIRQDEAARYLGVEHLRRAGIGNTTTPFLEQLAQQV